MDAQRLSGNRSLTRKHSWAPGMKPIEIAESLSSLEIVEQPCTQKGMMGSSKSRILSKDMILTERSARQDPQLEPVQDRMILQRMTEDWTLSSVNFSHSGVIMIF